MTHFTSTTTETRDPKLRNAIFMGRGNWQVPTEPRPLDGRLNIVVSRRSDFQVPDGVLAVQTIDLALEALSAEPYSKEVESVFCIGGGRLYEAALSHPACEALLLTRIDARYDCDVFFPPFEALFARTYVLREGQDGDVRWRVEDWRPHPGLDY